MAGRSPDRVGNWPIRKLFRRPGPSYLLPVRGWFAYPKVNEKVIPQALQYNEWSHRFRPDRAYLFQIRMKNKEEPIFLWNAPTGSAAREIGSWKTGTPSRPPLWINEWMNYSPTPTSFEKKKKAWQSNVSPEISNWWTIVRIPPSVSWWASSQPPSLADSVQFFFFSIEGSWWNWWNRIDRCVGRWCRPARPFHLSLRGSGSGSGTRFFFRNGRLTAYGAGRVL